MRLAHPMVSAGLALLAACGSSSPTYGGGGASCTPTATQVCMLDNLTFSPATLTVPVGTTVTWKNQGTVHTVTSATGSGEVFNSGNPPAGIAAGGTFTHTFATAGTFPYYCQYHGLNGTPPTGMHGTITVQ